MSKYFSDIEVWKISKKFNGGGHIIMEQFELSKVKDDGVIIRYQNNSNFMRADIGTLKLDWKL